jgi:hypothetical protein
MRLTSATIINPRDPFASVNNAAHAAEGLTWLSSGCAWIALLIVTLWLTGCAGFPGASSTTASTPTSVPEAVSSLQVEKEVPPLSRMEVITAIGECERAGMRPVVISTKRKVNNQLIPSVVDVTCLPKL